MTDAILLYWQTFREALHSSISNMCGCLCATISVTLKQRVLPSVTANVSQPDWSSTLSIETIDTSNGVWRIESMM